MRTRPGDEVIDRVSPEDPRGFVRNDIGHHLLSHDTCGRDGAHVASLPERLLRFMGVDVDAVERPHHGRERKYILEATSGGVAVFDFDRDGDLDIYLVKSLTVKTAGEPKRFPSALYENRGVPDGSDVPTFVDVAVAAGVAYPGWGVGVCVADYDGDGFQDLYVTGIERNHLYRNLGGERSGKPSFADVSEEAGVAGGGWSTGCGFADYDRDGDLDLFVSRYQRIGLGNLPEFGKGQICTYRDIPVHCGPRGLPGMPDLFYRNDGGGRFTEAAKEVGVDDPDELFGLGVAWVDVDADGWLDLFVANDTKPNFLYMNRRDGTFEDMAFLMGVAVSEDGKEQGSMGVAVGDYRNEGRPSLFVTNFAEEYNVFYLNQGGYFDDVSFTTATALPSLPRVGWGTSFFDADNDGWLDLVLVNGHVYPQMEDLEMAASAPYRQRPMLYRNRRDGTFEEIAEAAGDPLTTLAVSRGSAVGDLDGDGRLDLVINNLEGQARILLNDSPHTGRWLMVKLVGRAPSTDALGAVITVRIGEQTMTRYVQSGTGYLSQDDMRQHFGLGEAARADSVEVRWPDGTVSERTDVEADRLIVIEQPESTAPSATGNQE